MTVCREGRELGRRAEGGSSMLGGLHGTEESSLVWNPGGGAGALCYLIPAGRSRYKKHMGVLAWGRSCGGGKGAGEVRVTHEQLNIPSRSISNSEPVSRPQKAPTLEESTHSHHLPYHPISPPLAPLKAQPSCQNARHWGSVGGRVWEHVRTPKKTPCSVVRGQKRDRPSLGQRDGRRDLGAARYR